MVALPAITPVTEPVVALTDATVASLLLHVPPVPVEVNEVDAVAQTVAEPEMVPAKGSGLTVIEAVAVAVPQVLVKL